MKAEILKFAKSFARGVSAHSPAILTGFGVAGTVFTAILAAKATVKSMHDIEEEERSRYDRALDIEAGTDEILVLTTKETVELCWQNYIPPIIMGTATIGCIIGAQSINHRRTAALASAYTLSETALKEFTAKTVEHIGEKKTQKIKDDVIKDKVDNAPVSKNEVIFTSNGDTLFFDTLSGRYFKHDIQKVRAAINQLNADLIEDMYLSLNDFYYSLGLQGTALGADIGWNINKEGLIDVEFSAQKAENEEPCLALVYSVGPRYNYGELY